MRPVPILAWLWLLGLTACEVRSGTPVSNAAVRDAPTPAHEPNAPADTEPAKQASPSAPSAPPEVVFPDGTKAGACDSAPTKMSCIPGGPFVRGSDEGPKHSRPAAEVWVQTFYMDVYEVTYAEYRSCAKEKKCNRAGPRYTDFDHPDMPITGISWFDALGYCEAHGKRLPTEAEWEKAARGPDGGLHPWGDEPATCEQAIIKDAQGRACGQEKQISKPEVGRPWDVGSRPVGAYGLFDMIGNSWEWVQDWYAPSYERCGDACLGIDPRGPCDGSERCPGYRRKVLRGGSWYWDASHATGIYRRSHVPNNEPYHHFGFRCAASVEQAQALAQIKAQPTKKPSVKNGAP